MIRTPTTNCYHPAPNLIYDKQESANSSDDTNGFETENWNMKFSYARPFLPTDIWLHNILPHLDGTSLLNLSLCCKDNYNIFVSNTHGQSSLNRAATVLNCDYDLGTAGWEKCCRQRWPSVKQFHLATNDPGIQIQKTNLWYECYRRMHVQDKKVDNMLSELIAQDKSQSDCYDLLCDLFCSNIAVEQLFDGLLLKCLPCASPTTPFKVLAGLMLLEINQRFSMLRLRKIWADKHDSTVSLTVQGALLISQFCQSVSELIQRRSLYAVEEEFYRNIDAITNQIKSNLIQKRGKTFLDPHDHVDWVEGMKQLFSGISENKSSDSYEEHSIPFRGNTDNYYDWHNSLLDKVMNNRKGIPITLCIIYAFLIHRALGVEMDFIGLPGHFLLRLQINRSDEKEHLASDPSKMIFIDAFHGGRPYNIHEVRDIVETRYGVPWNEKFISPLTPDKVWTRMIANIVNTARDYSTPSQNVLLDVVKRRLGFIHLPPFHDFDVNELNHQFLLLSPLCSFESNDLLALSYE